MPTAGRGFAILDDQLGELESRGRRWFCNPLASAGRVFP
ncbi:hypothetical protein FHT77_005756 [Rhizobium sp. BK181]|nr:hypothetical protein [Rhizobium sp. BK181]